MFFASLIPGLTSNSAVLLFLTLLPDWDSTWPLPPMCGVMMLHHRNTVRHHRSSPLTDTSRRRLEMVRPMSVLVPWVWFPANAVMSSVSLERQLVQRRSSIICLSSTCSSRGLGALVDQRFRRAECDCSDQKLEELLKGCAAVL